MPNKTSKYQLNQWQGSDPVLRTDFNEDNAKLEAALNTLAAKDEAITQAMAKKADQTALTAALATKAEIVLGTYTGDGAQSRVINLGFQPKAVLVCNNYGQMGDSTGQVWTHGGLALPGSPVVYGNSMVLEVVSDGFRVHTSVDEHARTNLQNNIYHYLAIK